jgi:aryl-alcohol dehydrogenase-like predicted oxidoreductase
VIAPRTLGQAGPRVSAIGLGLAALGRPGYLNIGHGEDLGYDRSPRALERRTHEVLDAALDGGVTYFDAARSYGRAENFLCSWLRDRGIAPGQLTIGSKWGYEYTAGWRIDADPPEVKELTLDNFRRQFAQTRELLGQHLAIYQIHSATIDSGVLDDEPLMTALGELRGSGVKVGLTTSGTDQAATIDRAVERGGFDTVQSTWNPLEPSAGRALQRAHDSGMGVIVKEAMANGRLAPGGRLDDVAEARDTSADAVAIAAALAQPFADVVLSGAATREHLRSNLRGAAIDPGELPDIAEPRDDYWSHRSSLAWT